MCKVINVTKDGFEFDDIPFIRYPMHIKSKRGDKYFNLKAALARNECHSRAYQLSHKSTQAYLFDKFIEIDYFKLKGINYDILREVPIINTDLGNDPDRSYYLLDYFIPDLSLCIELDSDFHDPIKDEMKDNFLNSISIKVYRINDFQVNTKEKLELLYERINKTNRNAFRIEYNLKEYEEYRSNYINNKYNELIYEPSITELEKINYMYKNLLKIGITPKKAEQYSKISLIDKNIFLALINKSIYKSKLLLKDIFRLVPMSRCNPSEYRNLVASLLKLGVTIEISKN